MLAAQLRADLGVRALVLVIDGLADVVEQTGAARELDVGAELGGDEAREVADLDRVQQHVLRVRLAELQPAEVLHELGMHAVQAEIEDRLLAGLLADLVDFLLGLAHALFDARRMDAAVGDERARSRAARSRGAPG